MSIEFNWEAIYRTTPIAAQNLLASVNGWWVQRRRYGGAYAEIASVVAARRNLAGSHLLEFQRERLARHLARAAAAPYWRNRFADFGVNPSASDPFGELAKLPVLDKATVKAHVEMMLIPGVDRRQLTRVHTSGTTGSGLVFWETRDSEKEQWATWWRYRQDFGITPSTRCGYFGGRSVVPVEQTRPPFWRHNLPGRQILFSAYHLSERTVADYWSALERHSLEWVHGYPSMLNGLAELAEAAGLPRLPALRWITTGAENLLAGQRGRIERVLGCPVHQHYGMAEAVANISEGRDGTMRVDEDFAYVEFVPVTAAPGVFRIVGTNWTNPALPLLRYDIGDLATLPAGVALHPGGTWRTVSSIDGRQEDAVILPSGARVGRLDHIFKDLTTIREAKIVQPELGRLVFQIVQGIGYRVAEDEARLLHEARSRLGESIEIQVVYVSALPRTSTGKLRFVVSEVVSPSAIAPNSARR